jgi:glycosyltransferase involved in cell wall biosynthesis
MRILIVTHSFPPDLTPRAFRLAAIAEELVKLGHDVHVLCATTSDTPYEGQATVHRVADPILGRRVQRLGAAGAAGTPQPRRGLRQMKKLLIGLWRKVYWPDYAGGWVLPATAAARRLHQGRQFDWVLTTSHPFSGHVVWLCAGRNVPATGWLVDIGDPYSQMADPAPYNRLLYGVLSRWIEGRVLRRADSISVTTDATRALFEAGFPPSRGKLSVIGPLLSLPAVPARTRPRSDEIRIVFVGTLYRTLRNPTYFLEVFMALRAARPDRTYRLHFYGAANDCQDLLERYVGDGSVVVHGLVDRVEVTRAMADADAVLNIGNHSRSQLGSKVIEYMAMGRPIINVTSLADDTSIATLADHPSTIGMQVRSAAPSAEDISRLGAFLDDPAPVPQSYVASVIDKHSEQVIAQQYASLLQKEPSAR